jgi:hypothetical protein
MKVKTITKRQGIIYDFEAEGSKDKYGDSKITGVLILKNSGMSVCFDKLYDDRNKAGQVGSYDVLIYEGHSNEEGFGGTWYYKGYKHDTKFSGEMSITGLKEYNDSRDSKLQIKLAMESFLKKNPAKKLAHTEEQRSDAIGHFQQTKWIVSTKQLLSQVFIPWEMNVLKVVKLEECVYDFEAEGTSEKYGNSSIAGRIIFTQAGMRVCFDKLEDKKKKERDEGQWKLVIHEGLKSEGVFNGLWHNQGFEVDYHKSGEMTIVPME